MRQLEKILFLFLFLICFSVAAIPFGILVIPLRLLLIAISLFYIVRFWSKGRALILIGFIQIMLGVFFKLMHWPMANGLLILGSTLCVAAGIAIIVGTVISKTFNHRRYFILLVSILFMAQNLIFLARTFGELIWAKPIFFHLMPAITIISAIVVYLTPSTKSTHNIVPRFFALVACYNIYSYASYLVR